MKLRTLTALGCAMVLSLSAAGMAFATEPDCGTTEQGAAAECPTATATDQATSTPTDEATSTPSDEATSTPTDEATSTPTDEATSTPTDESTPSDGGVAAETGTPSVTLPPTDSLSGGSGNGSGGVPIAVLAMAGLLAAILLMTPATAGLKRGKRK